MAFNFSDDTERSESSQNAVPQLHVVPSVQTEEIQPQSPAQVHTAPPVEKLPVRIPAIRERKPAPPQVIKEEEPIQVKEEIAEPEQTTWERFAREQARKAGLGIRNFRLHANLVTTPAISEKSTLKPPTAETLVPTPLIQQLPQQSSPQSPAQTKPAPASRPKAQATPKSQQTSLLAGSPAQEGSIEAPATVRMLTLWGEEVEVPVAPPVTRVDVKPIIKEEPPSPFTQLVAFPEEGLEPEFVPEITPDIEEEAETNTDQTTSAQETAFETEPVLEDLAAEVAAEIADPHEQSNIESATDIEIEPETRQAQETVFEPEPLSEPEPAIEDLSGEIAAEPEFAPEITPDIEALITEALAEPAVGNDIEPEIESDSEPEPAIESTPEIEPADIAFSHETERETQQADIIGIANEPETQYETIPAARPEEPIQELLADGEPGSEEFQSRPRSWLTASVEPETEESEEADPQDERPKSKRGRKSLKQVSAEADLIDIPADEVLFSKQYYTMGEVADMFKVNQSLLRFWESEFSVLQPRKNKKGDRYFRPVDIKNLHLIHHLLRQRKYTIEGAKEFLKTNKKADQRFEAIQRLQQIRAFLLELRAHL